MPEVLQFSDYAHWQKSLIDGGHFDADIAHWQSTFQPPVPFFSREPNRKAERGESVTGILEVNISSEQTARLKALGRQWRTSVNIMLLAAYAEVLCTAGKQTEVVIQVPAANRPPGSEEIVGCFVENMLLRVHRAAGLTPRTAVETLNATVRNGLQHLAPLPTLLQRLDISDANRSRLHRAVLNWGQLSTFREDLQRPFGDLEISSFEGSTSDGLDLPDYAFSVLNINENNEKNENKQKQRNFR